MNVAEIKALHSDRIMPMIDNLLEVGKWMDRVEARLIREGKLRIIDGKYHFIQETKVTQNK